MTVQSTAGSSERLMVQPAPGSSASGDSGILVVDKPAGPTSFDVVSRLKRWLRLKKAGHCGTLDPFATGVLLVCTNQATRIADQFLHQDKVYEFTLVLGVQTDTLDRTGQVVSTWDGPIPTERELTQVLNGFQGACSQQVPRFAAVRVEGKRLYEWSRSGVEVVLPKRDIHIHCLELLGYKWPRVFLKIHCSKGTYVRQLAADIGELLGCGAHVGELRRVASGSFTLEHATRLEEFAGLSGKSEWRTRLIPMTEALAHLPAVVMQDQGLLRRLLNGQLDLGWQQEHRARFPEHKGAIRIVNDRNHLAALWWPYPQTEEQRQLRVFLS